MTKQDKKKICDEVLTLFNDVMKKVLNTSKEEAKTKDMNDDGVITLLYNDYLDYVQSGRRAFTNKVPFHALVKWAKEKHIASDTGTIWAIRESIYKTGIKARDIFGKIDKAMDNIWANKLSDEVFEIITNEIDKIFEK